MEHAYSTVRAAFSVNFFGVNSALDRRETALAEFDYDFLEDAGKVDFAWIGSRAVTGKNRDPFDSTR